MAVPKTRAQFKEYCLKELGKPVIDINASNEQIEDRIDDALQYWQEYHYNGSQRVYLKKKITDTDKANRYVPVDENILGVIRVFQTGALQSASSLFSVQYHLSYDVVFNVQSFDMTNYYMAFQHLNMIEDLLEGHKPLRFNEHTDRVYIDMDWNRIPANQYLVLEAYKRTDPEEWPDVWRDRWLRRYATQLIKRQWGSNLKKFEGMSLPGNITFNGQKIYDEAEQEIRNLEDEMIASFSLPVSDMIG